jgi:hypothetical protein
MPQGVFFYDREVSRDSEILYVAYMRWNRNGSAFNLTVYEEKPHCHRVDTQASDASTERLMQASM